MKEFKGFDKGVNLGGWLSQCLDHYNEEHYSTFILEEDIQKISSWGLDHVRLPVDYNVIQTDDGQFIESGFAHIDRAIAWCEKYGLNLVLDIHKACGFVFDDASYCSFFTDEKMQDLFVQLWQELARRYGNKQNVVFELLNEVTAREFAEPWNRIAKRTMAAIREIATETKILIGGIFNSSIFGLTLLEAPFDENVVFTFHCYSPMPFTHQGAHWIATMPADYRMGYPVTAAEMNACSQKIFGDDYYAEYESLGDDMLSPAYFEKMFATALEVSRKFDVPLYCGEYGVIDLADADSTLRWYKDIHAALVNHNIPRAAWSYKEMNFGLSGAHYAPVLSELLKAL
ncbi:MAG: cellulase family glycosylhydrolase [Clostridia bacterium]|nr:cellulase family glycosylhydrolase [Clostridia bacterium]